MHHASHPYTLIIFIRAGIPHKNCILRPYAVCSYTPWMHAYNQVCRVRYIHNEYIHFPYMYICHVYADTYTSNAGYTYIRLQCTWNTFKHRTCIHFYAHALEPFIKTCMYPYRLMLTHVSVHTYRHIRAYSIHLRMHIHAKHVCIHLTRIYRWCIVLATHISSARCTCSLRSIHTPGPTVRIRQLHAYMHYHTHRTYMHCTLFILICIAIWRVHTQSE